MRLQKNIFLSILSLLFMGIFCGCLEAAPLAQSGPEQVSLVEVFSSEGCSSCPPAEEWVSRLGQDPRLWKEFVPAVFHVDYWDYLGWKDLWARKEYTDRQRAYAGFWRSKGVYTPGVVLNGREWKDWYKQSSIDFSSKKNPGVLSVEDLGGGKFLIIFKPGENISARSRYQAHAAFLGSEISSDVKHGENSGRVLRHDFTVLDLFEGAMDPGGDGSFQKEIVLKAPSNLPSGRPAVSVWISREGDFEPVQAAGGYL